MRTCAGRWARARGPDGFYTNHNPNAYKSSLGFSFSSGGSEACRTTNPSPCQHPGKHQVASASLSTRLSATTANTQAWHWCEKNIHHRLPRSIYQAPGTRFVSAKPLRPGGEHGELGEMKAFCFYYTALLFYHTAHGAVRWLSR